MNDAEIEEVVARKFLLGELTPEERGEIEEQAFMDRNSFLSLQAAADDLVDESLTDDLAIADRERFETYFLSQPGRRVDLRIGRALQKHVSQVAVSPAFGIDVVRPSFWEWLKLNRSPLKLSLAAAALILAAVIGTWWVIYILRQDRPAPIEVQKQSTETPTPPNNGSKRPEQPANSPAPKEPQIKAPTRNQPSATIYSFLLIPGGPVRGENNVTTVPIPVAIGTASFRLPLIEGGPFRSYEATLVRDGGKAIRKWNNLEASESSVGKVIQLSVPVGLLKQRQLYRFLLRGISEDGKPHEINSYYFQVIN